MLYQLKNQANWELVIMWVNDKPLDDEHGPVYTMYIFQVFLATNLVALTKLRGSYTFVCMLCS